MKCELVKHIDVMLTCLFAAVQRVPCIYLHRQEDSHWYFCGYSCSSCPWTSKWIFSRGSPRQWLCPAACSHWSSASQQSNTGVTDNSTMSNSQLFCQTNWRVYLRWSWRSWFNRDVSGTAIQQIDLQSTCGNWLKVVQQNRSSLWACNNFLVLWSQAKGKPNVDKGHADVTSLCSGTVQIGSHLKHSHHTSHFWKYTLFY